MLRGNVTTSTVFNVACIWTTRYIKTTCWDVASAYSFRMASLLQDCTKCSSNIMWKYICIFHMYVSTDKMSIWLVCNVMCRVGNTGSLDKPLRVEFFNEHTHIIYLKRHAIYEQALAGLQYISINSIHSEISITFKPLIYRSVTQACKVIILH